MGRPRAGLIRRSKQRPYLAETSHQATSTEPRIINLMRVPGVHQVLLKVQVAELNRTGLRNIGGDFLWCDPKYWDHSSGRRSRGMRSLWLRC